MASEYSKVLIQGDIEGRLTVPESWMDLLGREFVNGDSEVQVRAVDSGGMFWEFFCKTRRNGPYKKPVFQARGWNKFVHYVGLRAGDKIVLQEYDGAQFRGISYRIIAQRRGINGLWENVEPPKSAVPGEIQLF